MNWSVLGLEKMLSDEVSDENIILELILTLDDLVDKKLYKKILKYLIGKNNMFVLIKFIEKQRDIQISQLRQELIDYTNNSIAEYSYHSSKQPKYNN